MKLTRTQKDEIKKSEKTNVELAKEHGVSSAAISKIRNGKPSEIKSSVTLTFTEHNVIVTIPKKMVTRNLLANLI